MSKITANTEIKSAWGVRCSTELAGVCNVKSKFVKKSLPIDMVRSNFIEITKSLCAIFVSKNFHVSSEGKMLKLLDILCVTLRL